MKVQADYPTKRAAARRLIQQAVAMMDGTTVNTWRLEADLMNAFQQNVPQNGHVLPDEGAK